jgi:nicotinamide phosphoribosyltransferase
MENLILMTDSYKASHWKQYPPNTTKVYSYIEARGGEELSRKTLFFGLQMFLKKYLTKPITQEMIDEADLFFKAHGEPFNKEGWEYILNKYDGFLPVVIKAVPEGTLVDLHNILVSIENTDPECYWLTSYIETMLVRAVWYPTTVATISYKTKEAIMDWLNATCDDPEGQISFKLHDFGGRGVSSSESAEIGGAAHLVSFLGSDTVEGIVAANKYYNCPMSAFSIPAAEHSTITVWGRENEAKAYENMLEQFGGKGKIFACVSDSYDIYKAASDIWGNLLRTKVLESGGTLVVRPDSGYPPDVVIKLCQILGAKFGYTINKKGFNVLNPVVRIIQGDGCTLQMIDEILRNMYEAGWSAENIAFGMGGGLLQKLNRDTFKFAMKASFAIVNECNVNVYKQPITDPGKNSKRGKLVLVKTTKGYKTINDVEYLKYCEVKDVLIEVFNNGIITKEYTMDEVRANSRKGE